MEKLPKKINSIIRRSSIFLQEGFRHIFYELNEQEENATSITVKLPEYYRPEKSYKIIDSNQNFVNGFKIVKTENDEYAYLRESDNFLLPFRYDVASDFNEFGFAIVAKDGSVSWINKNFKYLNNEGKLVEEDLDNKFSEFEGWQGVSSFSKGNLPLSRVYDGRNTYARTSYFGTDGKIKKFYRYDGKIDNCYKTSFRTAATFNEKGYTMADEYMLFANGCYISFEDLIKLSVEKNFIDSISEEAEKCLDKEKRRILKKECN